VGQPNDAWRQGLPPEPTQQAAPHPPPPPWTGSGPGIAPGADSAGYPTVAFPGQGYPPPAYGQQPAYVDQAGYGHQGYGYAAPGYPPTYGDPLYGGPGQGPQGYLLPGYGFAPEQPGGATVITAGVIQIVQSALFVLAGLFVIFVAGAINGGFSQLESDTGLDATAGRAITGLAIGIGTAVVLFAVFMIVLAALAMRRQRWAAITSVVLQSVAAVLTLVGLAQDNRASSGNVLFLLSSVAVIVLFVIPPSSRYLAAKS